MPKRARYGDDTVGLLAYLFGPGRHDEHEDAHLVAAWAPGVVHCAASAGWTTGDLALLLDAPVAALDGGAPSRHVYHVAVRNAPCDRVLSDAEWAEVAREMMHTAGIAPLGDRRACRWVAVRHAADHIHIAATAVREDGRLPRLRQDFVRMQQCARHFEVRFGLTRLVSGDRTARRWATAGELAKARRLERAEPVRRTLQRIVRQTASAAGSQEVFFERLESAGVRVQQRTDLGGVVTGYAVALPGDRNAQDRPVWYGGSALAVDLSLPRIRERWHGAPSPPPAADAALRAAEVMIRDATEALRAAGPRAGAGDVGALGDLLAATAGAAPAVVCEEVRRAADEFERAARAPGGRDPGGEARRCFRAASQALADAGALAGRNDTAAFLSLLTALVLAVDAAQRWHAGHGHSAQAEAAARAELGARQAVEICTGALAHRSGGGSDNAQKRSLGSRTMAATVQQALPRHARDLLTDPAWPALRRRLVSLQQRGHDPAQMLTRVASSRELTSAHSVAEVLCWRLDGWMRAATRQASPSGRGATGMDPARATPRLEPATGTLPRRAVGADGPKRTR
ncbi:mobilization protein [Kitasatospora sp. NPDC057692]|uniref:mobilization protein n=1 Tax=Kitasatospora sp. NPDC057692 TaxID=3346215 RepID=UPI0036C564D5